MEMENNIDIKSRSVDTRNKEEEEEEDDDVALPGFRFHPTDEELVGFYLRRKLEKRRISIELIKEVDVYKYDPWDLPKGSNIVGEKEWYFFCKRGRKYKNSIRPNRVTGSGFWKATGIDKPIYSSSSASEANSHGRRGDHCSMVIGLKKSLVFYRGSAGKGTKTDWMMHEFRHPPADHHDMMKSTNNNYHLAHRHAKTIGPPQEAEVWTLCRIFKRNHVPSYKKCIPPAAADQKDEVAAASANKLIRTPPPPPPPPPSVGDDYYCNENNNNNNDNDNGNDNDRQNYISFNAPAAAVVRPHQQDNKRPSYLVHHPPHQKKQTTTTFTASHHHPHQLLVGGQTTTPTPTTSLNSLSHGEAPSAASYNSTTFTCSPEVNDMILLKHAGDNWDELRSVVDLASDPFFSFS